VSTNHSAIADLLPDLIRLRHDLHAHPELGFAEHRTAAVAADAMRALGLDVATGIGGTGVVATLRNGSGTRSIGLRADMDALPIVEASGLPHASRNHGVHHGCGHDGHTTSLIGAARQLARARNFDGTVHFIFQPAEEGLGGAHAMIKDGLFDRFPCDAVYALHNWPSLPLGTAQTRHGPIMAAADRFEIVVHGRGGHAALPQQTPDAILAASHLVLQLNTIVARDIDPTESAVLSVTKIEGGHAHNVLPAKVVVVGTVRSFNPQVQDRIEARLREVAAGVAASTGTHMTIDYLRYYPATINSAREADIALAAATAAGLDAAPAPAPAFTSEDFAFMLQARPGAYLWLGQARANPGADGERPLHHPGYDFNDDALPLGISWFVSLVEDQLRIGAR
jgi:amidohydrolase